MCSGNYDPCTGYLMYGYGIFHSTLLKFMEGFRKDHFEVIEITAIVIHHKECQKRKKCKKPKNTEKPCIINACLM